MQLLSGYSHSLIQGPCLQIDDFSQFPAKRNLLPVWNTTFSLTRLQVTYCIGKWDPMTRSLLPCPTKATINAKSTTCYPCSQSLVFHPAFYNLAPDQVSPQQKAYNLTPHVVYLAHFGNNLYKVGMANEKRTYTRWLEQGAYAAVVLQRCPTAYVARELEASIHLLHKIPERINLTQKQKSLQMTPHFEEAVEKLNTTRQRMAKMLLPIQMEEAIHNLQTAYFQEKLPYPIYEAANQKTWHTLAGHGRGQVGEVLIYQQGDYHFMQPLKALLGKVQVSLSEEAIPLTTNLQLQLSIFR